MMWAVSLPDGSVGTVEASDKQGAGWMAVGKYGPGSAVAGELRRGGWDITEAGNIVALYNAAHGRNTKRERPSMNTSSQED